MRCELAQLHAEVAILKQQVEVAAAEGHDVRGASASPGGERSAELAEVQAQVDEARLRRQQLQVTAAARPPRHTATPPTHATLRSSPERASLRSRIYC